MLINNISKFFLTLTILTVSLYFDDLGIDHTFEAIENWLIKDMDYLYQASPNHGSRARSGSRSFNSWLAKISRNYKNELLKVFSKGFSIIYQYYLTVSKFLECYF